MADDTQNQNNPAPGGQDEIANYYDGVKKLEMQGYETGIRKARNALIATAVLVFIGEMLSASMAGMGISATVLIIALVEAGIFVALALWTKTKPYTAIVTGLIIFGLMWIAAVVVVGGRAAYSGIIVRIVIIVYLASALKPAKAWEDAKKNR